MIPRFIHEQLIDNCDILVEKFKEYEKIKAQNNMELKKGDKIICITDAYKDFTKGKEYEIFNIDLKDIIVKNDYGVSITFLTIHNSFKLKKETETAYKETEGKLHYELDFEFITQMAERMASNKKEGKYSMYNWMKPMSKTDLINLIQAQYRHAMDLMNFKFDDDGRPYGTLEAFSNNAMMINYQLKTYFKDYKFSKEDLLELSDKKKGKFKGILSDFKEENEVSPSSKINTTDSTGLLTEEK